MPGAVPAVVATLCAVWGALPVQLAPGIELLPPRPGEPAWPAPLVAELRAGLAALPPELRAVPGGPLRLRLHAESSDWGLGDGTPQRPEWSSGLDTFHLYAYREGADARALDRLRDLDAGTRETLWRRRAAVHAVVRRHEAAHGWARSGPWRRAGDWLLPFERPLTWSDQALNVYAWAFSRRRGQAAPELDLATFAEELLVPAEALAPTALPPDDQVRCQEFTKARALAVLLLRDAGAHLPPRGACPAFDGWARPDALSHVEVLYVAATGRAPESLFGHLMLRPVHTPGPGLPDAPSFGTVIQLAAFTGGGESALEYLAKGLTGGFQQTAMTQLTAELFRQTLELEQRTVRRFRLALPKDAALRVAERAWELERRGYFRYFFFTDNCASSLVRLVNVALDDTRQVSSPGLFYVAPTMVLDALARARVPVDGGDAPLLVSEGGAFLSTLDEARWAEGRRQELAGLLAHALPPPHGARVAALHAATASRDAEERAQAYRALGTTFEQGLRRAGPEAARAAFGYLHASALVEKGLLDALEADRLQAAAWDRRGGGARPSTEDVLAERQRVFRREADLAQATAARPRAPETAALLDEAEQRPFHAATEVLAALTAGPLSDVDARDAVQAPARALAQQETARARGALPRSGWGRLAAGAGVLRLPDGAWTATATLRSAVLHEELGEPLLHGYRPTSALTVLGGEVRLRAGPTAPAIAGSHVTVLRYRTLGGALPQQRTVWPAALGFGAALTQDDARDLGLEPRWAAHGEVLASNATEATVWSRLDLLSVGAEAQLRLPDTGPAFGAGPRVAFEHRAHLGGPLANGLRFSLAWALLFVPGRGAVHELRATLGASLLLPRLLGFHWLLRPELQAAAALEDARPPSGGAQGVLLLEPL